jgi:AbrB family looped-hinge helix DNA binding protein
MPEKLSHFISAAKVGPKGQIVIPKEIRDMFDIQSGDSLLIMADSERGIALHKQSVMEEVAKAIFEGQTPLMTSKESPEDAANFARVVRDAALGDGRPE